MPPAPTILIVPVAAPKHNAGTEVTVRVTGVGCVTVAVLLTVHPATSFEIKVYVPADKPVNIPVPFVWKGADNV